MTPGKGFVNYCNALLIQDKKYDSIPRYIGYGPGDDPLRTTFGTISESTREKMKAQHVDKVSATPQELRRLCYSGSATTPLTSVVQRRG